ncbi:MAG: ATP phosphoribosyltransferase regulatory subunit [Clostridia bacterium]|nr:ATP phosphoribosyltransferase regulatory subunit [Clostridia bacterium]
MANIPDFLSKEDELGIRLPLLFESRGYKKYRMSKFEEYSFYSDNRKFLTDEGVIAFNNADGRLMALKPDITLSIVKNAKLSEKLTRLYYNESVFRISHSAKDFREIKQCGIEVLGDIDSYITGEVILLAAKSLEMIDTNYSVSVSHNDIVLSLIDDCDISLANRKRLAGCIGAKNTHDFRKICGECGISDNTAEKIISLFTIDLPIKEAVGKIEALVDTEKTINALNELKTLCKTLDACGISNKINIDLSVTQHIDYYNGIVFRGYVEKAPAAVLSGGRYDLLAKKIRDNIGAVGFAVYLDNLNLYYRKKREYDTDILIINRDENNTDKLTAAANGFCANGQSVCVEREKPETYRCRKTYIFENGVLTKEEIC